MDSSESYTGSTVKSKRQIEKIKAKALKETYFLVTWIEATDGEVLYDVVNCKSVVPPECSNVLDVTEGTVCRVAYTDGQYYKAKILNIGTAIELRQKQKQYEKELEHSQLEHPSPISNSNSTHPESETPSKTSPKDPKGLKKTSKEVEPSSSHINIEIHQTKSGRAQKKDVKRTATPSRPKKSPKKKPINILSSSDESEDEMSESTDELLHATPANRKRVGSVLKKSPVKKKRTESAGSRMVRISRALRDESYNDSIDAEDFSDDDNSPPGNCKSLSTVKKGAQTKVVSAANKEWQKKLIPLGRPYLEDDSREFNLPHLELRFIQGKVKELEETTRRLNVKMKQQAKEILDLRRRTETPSSALDSASDISPFAYKSQLKPNHLKESVEVDLEDDAEHVMINSYKVDRLKLQSAKLQSDASKCALQLLGCLFSAEELVNGNPSGTTTAKDEIRRQTIKKLDPVRMKYIMDYVNEKWPDALVKDKILKKLTQKCTDYYNNRKELRHTTP